jgi:hypothetical protein
VDDFKEGDIIDYENNIDWECFIKGRPFHYIQWTHKILLKNGEPINDWIEYEYPPEYIEVEGIEGLEIKNEDPRIKLLSGEHSGRWAYIENKHHVKNKRFVHIDNICGVEIDGEVLPV